MNILLIGIQGTYNYGCEAIVRGTSAILHGMYPDVRIYYLSPVRYADDEKRLKGAGVNIIHYDRGIRRRIFVNKVLRHFKLPFTISKYSRRYLKKFDAVFSIGGDIYTIWSNGLYHKELVNLGNFCERINVPYILWGCSVGPFEKNLEIKRIFREHLSRISLIVAREPATIDYLRSMGIEDNVIFSFDPAFSVPSVTNATRPDGKTLGVNLSPLSIKYFNLEEMECVKIHAEMIAELILRYSYKIILLPHVVDCEPRDNDFLYLKKVYEAIPQELSKEVRLVDNDPGFAGIKEEIKQCQAVIAARMHCAINSIASGVPAIFLSYSAKAKGMSKAVYGTEEYSVPLTTFCKDNAETIKALIDKVRIPEGLDVSINNKDNVKQRLDRLIK